MLSTTSEYALRALAHLAQLSHGQTVLGRDLAHDTHIPEKYLSKIMLSLRNAGLVVAARGTGGGYGLLRPADAIHLIDVVMLFDGPGARPECLLGTNGHCNGATPCSAHAVWHGVRKTYLNFLEQTRLSDISVPLHESQVTKTARKKAN